MLWGGVSAITAGVFSIRTQFINEGKPMGVWSVCEGRAKVIRYNSAIGW